MQRRFLAVLLSVALTAVGASGAFVHVCQAMGSVARGSCDCEPSADHEPHAEHAHHAAHRSLSTPKLRAQPCCSIQASDGPGPVATNEVGSPEVEDAMFVLAGQATASVLRDQFSCGVDLLRERAPPFIDGPPRFIRHCSLLN